MSGVLSEDIVVGVASTKQENQASYDARFYCVTTSCIDVYSNKVWTILIFYVKTQFFENITKAIVHGFVKKWVFRVGNEIQPFCIRMCIYMC